MKYILIILPCVLGMIACRKNNNSLVSGSGSRLTGIFVDSPGITTNLQYTGDRITSIDQNVTANIEYTDSTTTLRFAPDSGYYAITYALTPSKLPLRIDLLDSNSQIVEKINFAKFFYANNTGLLDSVISFEGSTLNSFIFKCTYTGQNITQIIRAQIANNTRYPVDTFNFTYGNTPNIFRYTDSLLYIYTYPVTVFSAQPPFVASFFAETFSASTFNSMTISNVGMIWAGYSATYNMNFTQNADGKIIDESFSVGSQASFGNKKYYYQ